MFESDQSSQKVIDFESASSSGSDSEDSSDSSSSIPMAYNFEPSGTDSGNFSETSSDNSEGRLILNGKILATVEYVQER